MPHADDDALAALALGDPVEGRTAAHVDSCPACRAEVESLRRVVDAVRPAPGDVVEVAPPPGVWAAIAAATGVAGEPRAVVEEPVEEPVGEPLHRRHRREPRRGPARVWLAVAAALVVGVGAGVAGAAAWPDGGTGAQVLDRIALSGLPPTPEASGTAELVRTGDVRRLRVDVSRLADPDGFYEVWLLDTSLTRMYPVGVLSGTAGDFVVPPGVEAGDYPVVDVSLEPLDGNPAHSTVSVLRGELPA